ncbi:unnamed protein product [Scytosiphon promiscuus]
MSRAAALTGAAARRASFRAGSLSSIPGSAPPTKFIRSGKHGMSIRRVDSSDLAVRRAAAATAAAASVGPPTKRLKTANGRVSTAVARGLGRRSEAARKFQRAGGAKAAATAAGAVPTAAASVSPLSTAATARRAVLLTKAAARARSGATRRAAAVVVADARAKSSRLRLVRNMTLYRGKGQAVIVGKGGGAVKDAAVTANQQQKKSKKKVQKTAEPCLFFCRFGKCSKSDEECRFVHDKAKVAVCRAFLRKGGCDKGDECLLTHAVQAEKMPICIYFEKGMCFTPNCPYLHVKVSQNAAVCPSFLKGYCPDGTTCRLKHELPDPRKRKREAPTGGDQIKNVDGATPGESSANKKKNKTHGSTEPAPETGAGGAGVATPASTVTTGGGSFEGKSGESVLRSARAAAAAAVVQRGRGEEAVGRAGTAAAADAPAGGGRSGGAFSLPQYGLVGKRSGGDVEEMDGEGRKEPSGSRGQAQQAQAGAQREDDGGGGGDDDGDDDDDDLKPAFLRKWKKR